MIKTVLVDASSAILLHKVSLLEAMYDAYRLVMVNAVVEEITVANHPGAAAFQIALTNKRIHQISMQAKPDDDRTLSMRMGAGERQTILAYGPSQASFILIDDKAGVQACRKGNIPFINALLCPEILYASGYLQRWQRDALFERLLSIGRYAPEVVAYADRCRRDDLAHFLPHRPPHIGIHT